MFIRFIACCSRNRRLFLDENGQVLDGVDAQAGLPPHLTFEAVCAGASLSAAIARGQLFIWGDVHKALMLLMPYTYETAYTPPMCIPREILGNSPVRHVAIGDVHVLVVTEAGRLYTGGYGGKGQLGLGSVGYIYEQATNPLELTHVAVADVHVTGVAAGQNSSCFVARDGSFFAFGENLRGECAVDGS